jgi:membrane protein
VSPRTPERWIDRFERRLPRPIARVVNRLRSDDILLPAAGLSFYALVSVVPFVILALWLTGLVVGPDKVKTVGEHMARVAPSKLGIDKFFARVADLGSGIGIGAVVTLLWPATSYGSGLVRSFDRLTPGRKRQLQGLRGRSLSFVLVGVIPALALAGLLASYLGTQVLGTTGTAARFGGWVLAAVFGFGSAAVMVGLIYRLFTPTQIEWAKIWRGTLTAALGISLVTLAYVVYIRVGADFTTRYATSGLAALVLLALWLFLANAMLLIGYEAALEVS